MNELGHDLESVVSIFKNKGDFVIPRFQRGYSWEERNFKELWEDLCANVLENKQHFFGTMLVSSSESDGKEVHDVIDGQQRLTTFMILFRAMLDLVEKESFLKESIY